MSEWNFEIQNFEKYDQKKKKTSKIYAIIKITYKGFFIIRKYAHLKKNMKILIRTSIKAKSCNFQPTNLILKSII